MVVKNIETCTFKQNIRENRILLSSAGGATIVEVKCRNNCRLNILNHVYK